RLVARFALTLQDILAVFAPSQGIPTLTGDMRQTVANRLQGGSGGAFGRRGERARFLATGLGRLVDPITLNAELEMAGNWAPEYGASAAERGGGRGRRRREGAGRPEHR